MAIEGKDTVQTRPIRLGMVGGGIGRPIGVDQHAVARAQLDQDRSDIRAAYEEKAD